ncbi:MAG: response regulator receiver modulated diguanylate cyclase [Myxococcales bacterium]|nr:response regulator receiver modulated diguanylate cyclase [Myxococcales bacterium]
MDDVLVRGDHLRALLAAAEHAGERQLLSTATQSIAALLGDRGSCVLVEPNARVVFSTAAPSLSEWPVNLARYPEIVAALEQQTIVAIGNVHEDALLAPVRSLLPPELCSVAVVPLICEKRRLGVLMAQSATGVGFGAEDIATAALIGQMTARLLELARLRERERVSPSGAQAILRSDPPGSVTSEGDAADRSCRLRRILVVDDDLELAAGVAEMLRGEQSYDVELAQNGAEGLDRARRHPPDLILLDVKMPVLDGFATAERLGEDPITADIPILFLSASERLLTQMRALKLKTADFLAKPFDAEELLARIDRSMQHLVSRERWRTEAFTDELTGLGNLRMLQRRMAVEQSRFERYGTPLAVVMIDFDRLKKINDERGHAAGSEALAALGGVLRKGARETDLATRYGGDEFVVLLSHATLNDGMGYAERVLSQLRQLRPAGLSVTVSIGVAATIAGSDRSVTSLLEEADAAAYQAKRLGGDRACVYDRSHESANHLR